MPRPIRRRPLTAKQRALVAGGLPTVRKVAARMIHRLPRHVDIDDMVSAGMVGLVESAYQFDPKRNDSFNDFAEFRIRGAMLDDLRSRDTLSRDMRRLSNELRDATRKLKAQQGGAASTDEIASALGIGVDELYARQQKLSGSSVVGIDDAGPDLFDRIADPQSVSPFDAVAHMELLAAIEAAASQLSERTRAVLSLRYRDGWTLAAIGAAMGRSEARAFQLLNEAHAEIRDALFRAGIEDAA